ncbi:Hypothetical Protein FCC1311_111502 [Hondaea fermentalgiana]|uniref:Apple domain-containing protein n=1 Tax=Hondaea fermentalgiana TaxID=2315210 RepID=A0A2R5GVR7_9STRA|nr:Hypothetical Protein FCC1311_111502 [Hondaea fermentalgiana]|eukprot:GBG34927.1 Hypothetical Protein FCC1311_111502 [Hondaea fermentalgiana]
MDRFPGCVILGHPGYPTPEEVETEEIRDLSAAECRATCLERWKTSSYRGIWVTGSTVEPDYSATFRHETCYLVDRNYQDVGQTCTMNSDTGDLGEFEQDHIAYWRVYPCYSGSLHDGNLDSDGTVPAFASVSFQDATYEQDFSSSRAKASLPDRIDVSIRSDGPYICRWAHDNQDSAEADVSDYEPCLSWKHENPDDIDICTLYSTPPYESPFYPPTDAIHSRVSGLMYCNKDFSEDTAIRMTSLYDEPGCMKQHYNWGINMKGVEVENPHDCRRKCQEDDNCVLFVFNASSRSCYLKTAEDFMNETSTVDTYAGTKDCHTCSPGYYITTNTEPANGVDSCEPCQIGYYCVDGEMKVCQGGNYCGENATAALTAPSDEKQCSEDRSGTGCEHEVCRDSALGNYLGSLDYTPDPESFDFSNYAIPTVDDEEGGWDLAQELIDDSDSIHIKVTFKNMIKMNIVKGFNLPITLNDASEASIVKSWDNVNNIDCSEPSDTYVSVSLKAEDFSVGDNVTACLLLFWTKGNKFSEWDDVNTESSKEKETAKNCVTRTLKFHAGGNFFVSDISGNPRAEGVVIFFKVGEEGEEQYLVTDATSRVFGDLFDSSLTARDVDSTVTIINASLPDTDTDIRLCPDEEESECSLETVRELGNTYTIEHLKTRKIQLVDIMSRALSGTVLQSFNDGSDSCQVSGVTVEAFNVDADSSASAIATNVTSDDGTFVLNVPTNTQVRLEFTLDNHTFTIVSIAGAGLLDEAGVEVSDAIEGIEVQDTTMQDFNLRVAATLCDIPVGQVDITLWVKACPSVELTMTTTEVETTFSLPAANYSFELAFADDTDDVLLQSFEYQFADGTSARDVDLSTASVDVEMLHQPVPDLLISLESGQLYFDACANDELFDVIIEGGSTIEFEIKSQQWFAVGDGSPQFCGTLPDGTTVEITSELAPSLDVGCDANDPCETAFVIAEINAQNRSAVFASVVAGEPQAPLDDGDTHALSEFFVRNVAFRVRNEDLWASTTAGLDSTLRALVLGDKTLSEDATIAFASEDSTPLQYLYSPPGGVGSFASLEFEGSYSIEKTNEVRVENEAGVNVGVTISASVSSSFGSVKTSAGFETEAIGTFVSSYDNKATMTTESRVWSLETYSDAPGRDSDLVMFMGSVAKFLEAVHISLDPDTCKITSANTINWGNQVSSLVIYTRSSCENSLDQIEKTIQNVDETSDLAIQAQLERSRWLSLLQHWDDDYQAALNTPASILQGSNVLSLSGGASYSVAEAISSEVSAVTDYTSYSGSLSLSLSTSVTASVSANLWFVSVEGSTEVSAGASFKTTGSVERVTTKSGGLSTSISTSVEVDDSNEICLEFFRSPFSGTHVYRVCGGRTSCPHIPGTDAREVLALSYDEEPAEELTENTGSFSFLIDTSSMTDSDEEITVAISVDAQSMTGRVAYRIGASSLNQPVEVTMDARTVLPVTVFYERLDERVRSTTVTIKVASACDEGISRTLPFELNWASTCPTISWSGALEEPTATWALSSVSTTMPIAFSRGPAANALVSSTVTLWAVRYDGSATVGDWFRVAVFASGSSSLTLSAAQLGAASASKGSFLLELRAACAEGERAAGSSRSSRRLGVLDTTGPALMAWSPSSKVRVAASSFPVANFRFDEPVDCGHADLEATVTDATGELVAETNITCSSRLYDLTVVMETADAAAVALWSNTTATLELRGVHDLYGNVAEVITAGGARRVLAEGSMSKTFVIPELPEHSEDTTTLAKWGVQSMEERQEVAAAVYARILPSDQPVASTYVEDDDEDTDASDESSPMLAIGLGVAAGAVVVAAAAFVVLRRRRRSRSSSGRQTPQRSSGDATAVGTDVYAKVEASNPIYAAA